jgi:hypothetical protein
VCLQFQRRFDEAEMTTDGALAAIRAFVEDPQATYFTIRWPLDHSLTRSLTNSLTGWVGGQMFVWMDGWA